MTDFQFMRPLWLLLLLAAPLLYYLLRSLGQGHSLWHQVIPPALLKPLLPHGHGSRGPSRANRLLAPALLAIAAIALAGPSFRTAPSPLQQQDDSLVIVLDLSLSMLATDVEPDRLTRAKRKIRDLLATREGAYTGLVVYAADGHVVTPLTDDRHTVEGLLSALDPVIMPAPGNRADLGVARAVDLLDQGAPGRGRILLITDGLNPRYGAAIRDRLNTSDWELDGLLVGTENGAPIPVPEQGFLRDGDQVVIARATLPELASTTRATGGEALAMTTSDRDITQLRLRAEDHDLWQDTEKERSTTRRQDDGYWLLWLALPLALVGWRRGALALVALGLTWIPSGPAYALKWQDLWQTPEQRAPQLIEDDPAGAAARLEDPQWRGTALYRDGQYQSAADAFARNESAQAHYNRGNALARAGKSEAALSAWDKALELDPDHEAARHNQDVIRQYLEQQQRQEQKPGQQQSGDDQGNRQQGQNPSDSGSQPQDQQDGSQQQSGGQAPGDQPSEQTGQDRTGRSPRQQPGEQQADDRARQQPGETDGDRNGQARSAESEADAEAQADADALTQSQQQWLRRIPDNPGGLLRRKFMQQSRSRNLQPDENDTPW